MHILLSSLVAVAPARLVAVLALDVEARSLHAAVLIGSGTRAERLASPKTKGRKRVNFHVPTK